MFTVRSSAAQASAAGGLRSIYAVNAPGFITRGYSVLPRIVKDGRGRPAVTSWSDWCEKQPSKLQLESWARIPDADLSLACGFGGLISIDVDDDRPDVIAAVRNALPHCTVARRGSKGLVLLARHADGPQRTINIYRADEARKDPLVEIMGIGRSIAIPPSIHAKTGMPYRWIDPDTSKPRPDKWVLPALAELPLVTAAEIERLIAALAPWSRKPRPRRTKGDGTAPACGDILSKRYRAYALKGLADATAGLATLTEGRPTELFRAVCGLGWAVAHRVLNEVEFEEAFIEACEKNGLGARDGLRAIEASIASGLRWSQDDALPPLPDRRFNRGPHMSGEPKNDGHRTEKGDGSADTSAKNGDDAGNHSEESRHFTEEPLPLFREIPKGDEFPVAALGPVLGGMAKALHEAAVQSPLAICGTSVL